VAQKFFFVQGTIVQLNTSLGGLPKRAISEGFITPMGIEGDLHAHPDIHGGTRQAILIIASEVIDSLVSRGYPVFYGALGENLTTRGLTIRDLRIGDQLRAGGALLEVTASWPLYATGHLWADHQAGNLRPARQGPGPCFSPLGYERILCQRGLARTGRSRRYNSCCGHVSLTHAKYA
jgi:MOSC domain